MKISIAGDLGSGKSSVAKILCRQLGFKYLSTGQMHRNIAEEYGVNSLELNKIANTDESIDDRIDQHLIALNNSNENLIIDSRLAWHFVNNTLKIYLEVHNEVGADRVLGDTGRISEPQYLDRTSAISILKARKDSENERFLDRYKVNCDDESNYDLVINTSASSVEATSKLILKVFESWSKEESYEKYWISPTFIFPTEHVRLTIREDAELIKSEISSNGFNNQYPIECVKYNEFYFIWNGHKRCSGAIYNKIDFIPFHLLAVDDQVINDNHTATNFVKSRLSLNGLSWFYEWEDAHKFRFVKYPKLP